MFSKRISLKLLVRLGGALGIELSAFTPSYIPSPSLSSLNFKIGPH